MNGMNDKDMDADFQESNDLGSVSALEQGIADSTTHECVGFSKRVNLGVAIAVPLISAYLTSFISGRNIEGDEWYKNLEKAPWNPPGFVFGIVWPLLYISIGFASWLVTYYPYKYFTIFSTNGSDSLGINNISQSNEIPVKTQWIFAITVYIIQLAVNLSWMPVFIALHSIIGSLIIIIILDILVFLNAILFGRLNKYAGFLYIPYVIWLLYATSLNIYIVIYN